MSSQIERLRQIISRNGRHKTAVVAHGRDGAAVPVPIELEDPLIEHLRAAPGAIELDKIGLDSPALEHMRASGIKVVVPLVSNGELIGLLNLGPRLSGQGYSPDDMGLLENLGIQAAPALRVAQLVRQQQVEAAERARISHELRVARLIQQTLLPKELPALHGWHVSAFYGPAKEVGGDFYDFIPLADGRLAIIIGDVTDKGVPAALVMASTRAVLRGVAERLVSPGKVLERVNNLMQKEMPPNMFVTCLYALLDPSTGTLRYANAGHPLPFVRRVGLGKVEELRATGMPLGLMPDMQYEEKETAINQGENVLLYSDGISEAHNPEHEMFGTARLAGIVGENASGIALVRALQERLAEYTGEGWEQEDDVTMVTVQRCPSAGDRHWRSLAEFTVDSEAGNERQAMERVAAAVAPLNLAPRRLDRIKTAVAEATMNAMEHGNQYRKEAPVLVRVLTADRLLSIHITDQGGDNQVPEVQVPDIEAKLSGLQTPRGWGLFLIKSMVDDLHLFTEGPCHTIELIMQLGEEPDAS